MAGRQLGVRITDEEYDIILRRLKKISKEAPELGKMKPGSIARHAVKIYLESLTEGDLA